MVRRTINKQPTILQNMFGIHRHQVLVLLLWLFLIIMPLAILKGNNDLVKLCLWLGIAYILFSLPDYVK